LEKVEANSEDCFLESLIPEIRAVKDIEVLSRIIDGLKTVQTLEELRQIYQRDNLT